MCLKNGVVYMDVEVYKYLCNCMGDSFIINVLKSLLFLLFCYIGYGDLFLKLIGYFLLGQRGLGDF